MFKSLRRKKPDPGLQNQDRGILVFENTTEVIRAEKVLKAEGWKIKVKAPPPEIRGYRKIKVDTGLYGTKKGGVQYASQSYSRQFLW
ncbi:MAG TPA: DUF3343 domain-containing protein [Firmicutes bacterium]|jgi:hypothetical protein|nr:DUF3343 domain-containing protein [Bacillota bacterium]